VCFLSMKKLSIMHRSRTAEQQLWVAGIDYQGGVIIPKTFSTALSFSHASINHHFPDLESQSFHVINQTNIAEATRGSDPYSSPSMPMPPCIARSMARSCHPQWGGRAWLHDGSHGLSRPAFLAGVAWAAADWRFVTHL
jgi:hypothetical protein